MFEMLGGKDANGWGEVPSSRIAVDIEGDHSVDITNAAGAIAGDALADWEYRLLPRQKEFGLPQVWSLLLERANGSVADTMKKCRIMEEDREAVLQKAFELFKEKYLEEMAGGVVQSSRPDTLGDTFKKAA